MFRRPILFCASLVLVSGIAGAAWWRSAPQPKWEDTSADLPIPPFPPRIAEGSTYETCLDTLASDPTGAVALAATWQADGGGDGAVHCHGLALIASGQPASGAEVLEQLARQSSAPAMARASVLSQATQARMMVAQADKAVEDATQALSLSPDDTELFIMRATAEGVLGRFQDAVDDVSQALRQDAQRPDALVLRAMMRRKLNQLDLAQADVSRALTLDPDDPDALLERGILRQRLGDPAGARADWERARGVDPNSTTADLAQQDLSLLEAGPTAQ
ncbi:tetratricopeptide repeat protein [Acidisphaera sp. S103]|uniref:tetratricopeptide repeat protein n=1 Tax=Acidisphaera sp. S103 TaxID=1747223 RepID=UPI00131D2584|nr:tetratricopeptide repeat protein [Acidisphaera sp. S103]